MGQRCLAGIAAAAGVAVAQARPLAKALVIGRREISREQIKRELIRLERAIEKTEAGFESLAGGRRDDPQAADEILAAYRMMLRSEEIAGGARRKISESAHGAEWAVRQATDETVDVFDAMEDVYLKERGRDAFAVGDQLLRALLGLPGQLIDPAEASGAIAVAFEFSPLDVVRLHAAGVLGLVAETGGRNSHAAILARSFGLPFVAGVANACEELGTRMIALDADHGRVLVDPTEETLAELRARETAPGPPPGLESAARAGAVRTADGVEITLNANIEALAQIPRALAAGAGGIGLFRTEFLYLDRLDLPSEDEQVQDACAVMAALGGKLATFRTLDLGGDKLPLAVQVPEGHNPALGIRSIRFSLRRPDIFRAQLRALYRAAARGPLRIMFPLVADVGDLKAILTIVESVKADLTAANIEHDPTVPLGAMIETPSAAVTAEHLGRYCDFLSLGTNDLAQYAFAADRDNPDLDAAYGPLHPAALRLIKLAVTGAAAAGKPLSICGDMAADPACALVLLGLGLRELSVAAAAVPLVAAAIRGCHLARVEVLAGKALELESAAEVQALAAEITGLAG